MLLKTTILFAISLTFCGCGPHKVLPEDRATLETHYSPVEDLEALDSAALRNAQSTIDMCAYLMLPLIRNVGGGWPRSNYIHKTGCPIFATASSSLRWAIFVVPMPQDQHGSIRGVFFHELIRRRGAETRTEFPKWESPRNKSRKSGMFFEPEK